MQKPKAFWSLPNSPMDWMVIAIVVFVIVALFWLPNIEEGRTKARLRQREGATGKRS